jgi:hypothetical protein
MTGIDVGNFMGQNPGQLVLILREGDKTTVDVNVAARGGKSINGRAPDDRKMKLKKNMAASGKNGVSELIDVLIDFIVLNQHVVLEQSFIKLLAQFIFIFNGEGGQGRDGGEQKGQGQA